jgi:paraquat-inducible protein B
MYTLDQSFSSNNLRKIFDYENRKGNYLEGRFFSEEGEFSSQIEEITRKLKKCSSDFKELKKNKDSLSDQEYETKKIILNKTKEELKDKKENILNETFD